MHIFLWTLVATLGRAAAFGGGGHLSTSAFLLRHAPDADARKPAITPEVARFAILHRLVYDTRPLSLSDLPAGMIDDDALDLIERLGQRPRPLLQTGLLADDFRRPQLLVMVEAVSQEKAQSLAQTFDGSEAIFSINGGASIEENSRFIQEDVLPYGVADDSNCLLLRGACGGSGSALLRLNAEQDPQAIAKLLAIIPELRRLASTGERESLIIAIPDPSLAGSSFLWAGSHKKLRRQAEMPLSTSEPNAADPPNQTTQRSPPLHLLSSAQGNSIPACFDTVDACNLASANCSSRGECRNRWARGEQDGPQNGKVCYACHCKIGHNATHYGGAVCNLVDVSSPFWLLTGSALALLFLLVAAVKLLLAVGEEKLPGILGAGVSRTKS